MIHVVHSNRVEALAAALAEALPAPGPAAALFDEPWLVVPTRPLTLWLNLELARRRGISGSADTMTFDGLFARLTAEALPDVVLIERGHLSGELLALLADDTFMRAAALTPLGTYLRAAGDDAAAVDRRRVDLALALGRLFDEWTMSRPVELERWRTAPQTAPNDIAREATPLERAERALYGGLFGPDGRFARRGATETRRYLTRDALLAAGLDAKWRPPATVHVFAPHDITPGFQLALARLGQRTELQVYALNPCREFWEDLEAGPARGPSAPASPGASTAPAARGRGGRGRASAPNPRQLDLLATPAASPPPAVPPAGTFTTDTTSSTGRENPWLAAWARAGREATRRLNELTDNDSQFRAVDPLPASAAGVPTIIPSTVPSILGRVQQDILDRRPRHEGLDRLELDADGSIAVIGAPNPRREIESVAAEIWALIRADQTTGADPTTDGAGDRQPLRFSDIAVLVAGPAEPHLSLIPEVFHEAEELPHAVVDRGFGARSGLADALLGLMALPLGALTRRDVLDVVSHANVRTRFSGADPAVWLRLCEGLTIAHGADRAALRHTYIDRDAFNWDQGCRRLVLGRFARGPRSGAEDPLVLGDQAYSPAEVDPSLRADADALAILIRSLLADGRYARGAHLTVPEWMRFARAMMAAYLVPANPDDESARLAVFATLDQLTAQAAPESRVSLAVAVELLRAAVADLRGARGQMLGAGVVVGSLGALRGLPFRVVFVVGLEPRRFPSSRAPSPLDVLASAGAPGGESPRDADRYLFLEAALAARERLVLCALDRDPLTGEDREPSSVVLELLDQLGRGYLRDPLALVRRVPLHRDEDPVARAAFPGAAAEARARLVGDAARGAGAAGADQPATLVRGLGPLARDALSPLLGLVPAPITTAQGKPALPARERNALSLIDLRRFLECPLQGSARVFLGMRDQPDESDARETTDEPFDLPRELERGLLNDLLLEAWTDERPPDGDQLSRHYDRAVERHRAGHRLPAALFRDNVRRRHLRILQQWIARVAGPGPDGIATGAPTVLGPPRRVCFGRPEPYGPPTDNRDPIRLSVDVPGRGAIEVELSGTTEPQVRLADGAAPSGSGPLGSLGSLILTPSPSPENNDRDSFRGLIDVMAMVASSRDRAADAAVPVPFLMVCRPSRFSHDNPPAAHLLRFPALTPAAARAYLGTLAAALLGGLHPYLFPSDAIFRGADRGMSILDAIEQTRVDNHYRERSVSNLGPVPNPFDYPAPSATDAVRFQGERFGVLLAARAAAKGHRGGEDDAEAEPSPLAEILRPDFTRGNGPSNRKNQGR